MSLTSLTGPEKDLEASMGDKNPSSTIVESSKEPLSVSPQQAQEAFVSPYEWSLYRKVSIALVISFGQLVTLMSASMMAPALPQISRDLHMGSFETQVSFSVYLLGLGLAPFLVSPASEMVGRKPVWISCNVFYILWNTLCPVGKSRAIMIVGRLMAGSGASCGVVLSAPIIADMFKQEHRGRSLALATVFPYLGPALGPIIGGIVSQYLNWPWLFWVLSIVAGALTVIGSLILRETYLPILQQRHISKTSSHEIQAAATVEFGTLVTKVKASFAVPVRMLLRRPIIQLMGFLIGLEFGMYILVLSSYSTLFINNYGQSPLASSLHYISIAIGAYVASQGGGPLMDLIYRRMKARKPDQVPLPEYRIPSLALGVLTTPVGLFWLGWSAQSHAPWIMIDIGTAVFTSGGFATYSACLAYVLDECAESTASASAATRLLSNVFGFTFPLFAPQLFSALGYGWGASLLAFIWFALAVPITVLLWFRGPSIRTIGKTWVS